MFPRNSKGTAKGLEVSWFGIVEYPVRSESGRIIALRDQEYYVPGLPKYLHIIYPQSILKSKGYACNFIGEHDSYAELYLKEYKPGWQKAEPVEKIYIKYDPNSNPPTREDILPNQREKEVKALSFAVCITNNAKHNLTISQKELLRWNFRLVHIGFQNV